jgi:5-methylthioadenosine/S-adenosylhomocysteine deaminase
MADRLLLRGGSVVSMDPDVGDLPKGDVLIEGDTIAQIAPDISADAKEIDATGKVVIPGFIDSHRHTWEAAIRGCAPDATLDDYFVDVLDTFAPVYRPEDVYASNLAGALECVNAGITTLLDWSHINNTPDHPDAAIRGLQESGIRAVYAYGSANLSLNDYWNGSTIAIPADDVKRIRDTYFSSSDGLLTMAVATRGPGFCHDDVVRAEWNMARELGLPITVHVAMGRLAGRFGMIKQLEGLGLLGDDTTYIHCCYFSDEEWDLVRDTGGRISIAAQVEMQMGHGYPPIKQSRERGLRPSLSIDVVTTVPGDMFTQMRSAFGSERVRVNAIAWEADEAIPEGTLSARDTLQLATSNGAYTVGLEDRVGTLSPGKQADVVLIDATAPGTAPIIDPVALVTLCADVSNVDTVIIGGTIQKQGGKLTADFGRARGLVEASRDHLMEATAKRRAQ